MTKHGPSSVSEPLAFPSPVDREGEGCVLLLGTANVGKTSLFNALTGQRATISNYPGTTVELARAELPDGSLLVDTPGLGSLLPTSEEERVARDLVLGGGPRKAVVVADAKNLPRGLALLLQTAELDIPTVLCLNMADEADARGIGIDAATLEEILGVPVVATVATRGDGVRALRDALGSAAVCRLAVDYPEEITRALERIETALKDQGRGTRGRALLAFSGDEELRSSLAHASGIQDLLPSAPEAESSMPLSQRIRTARHHLAEEIAARVTLHGESSSRGGAAERFGELALHPVAGKLILVGVLVALFWLVGLVGAGTLVDGLETGVFGAWVTPAGIAAADLVLPFPHEHARETLEWELTVPLTPTSEIPTGLRFEREAPVPSYELTGERGVGGAVLRFVHDLFVGEYGLLTMGISYAFAIVLPIVTLFFFAFGILEDSGYLPRLAVVVNRAFRAMGLNGKAVLPMVLGLGCVTMATLTTRILETRKQRVLVVFLLALAIPCSAQLGVVLGLLATASGLAVVVWTLVVIGVLLAAGWLGARLLPGEDSPMILELPPIRRPLLRNIFLKTVARLEWYVREAVPLFLLGTLALFLAERTGLLAAAERVLSPIVTGFLGLPTHATAAFLVGFLRRDYGAVFLMDAAREGLLTPGQVLVAAVAVTLFVPCVANLFLIGREYGWKMAAAVTGTVLVVAVGVAGGVRHLLELFGAMS